MKTLTGALLGLAFILTIVAAPAIASASCCDTKSCCCHGSCTCCKKR